MRTTNGFLIVSKDSDFHGWSTLYAFPPKVIWLWTGNCSTEKIASLLRSNAAFIAEFGNNERDSLCCTNKSGAEAAFKHMFKLCSYSNIVALGLCDDLKISPQDTTKPSIQLG